MENFVAFTDSDFDESRTYTEGELVPCKNCSKRHRLRYGKSNGNPTNMLGFVKCGKKTFLATIKDKLVK